ncbi:phosphoglucomutase-like protein 5 [Nephila pilipes]|uniref:phosphoglucomutase (alpha-D-glucose-1,6-bisphosphate-dependent) n=1 Tax=Nephila pilipes TaxID=299642 RepID=A0A8X6MWE1_NEPPI|nr:phosphoglucomutase-like protein 5 [Nephila pilipes]
MTRVKLLVKSIQTEKFPDHVMSNIFLRRNLDVFCSPHFVEHITQALIYSVGIRSSNVLLTSDGRHRSTEVMERAARVLSGNAVRRILVESRSSVSAATCLIRERRCHFALFFAGGHHGPKDFLGLKVISSSGIPMREEILRKANQLSRILESYQCCEDLCIDFGVEKSTEYWVSERPLTVEGVDSTPLYVEITSKMFDFSFLKEQLQGARKKIIIDCSNGVTCPLVTEVFVHRLGISQKRILNETPLEDFGGSPTDPNSVTCKSFLDLHNSKNCDFGAVISPDGSRCLIAGKDGLTVSGSDSLAIIADQSRCIPFFQENPLKMVISSVCTSKALDEVAKYSSLLCFRVLPGWNSFASAMLPPPNTSSLFGEECSAVGVSSYTLDFQKMTPTSLDSFMAYFRETYSLRFEKIKRGKFGDFRYLDPFGLDPSLQTKEAQRSRLPIVFNVHNYVYPYGFIRKSILRNDTHQVNSNFMYNSNNTEKL